MIKSLYRFLNPGFQNLFLEYKVKFKPRYGHGSPPHPLLYEIISKNDNLYRDYLNKALSLKESIWEIRVNPENKISPNWNNGFLPGLDIIGIYTMINEFRPNKYYEIGSGNSTKVANKAIQDLKLQTDIVSIDPVPRAEIDKISNTVIRKPLEEISIDLVEELEENDILFIDNSHRILPNSDCTVLFLEIFPRLKKGVIVHIHDVYLPYDYPQFMCDRFYSEQYGLAIFIMSNPKRYQPLLPNYYISENKSLAKTIEPIWSHPNLKDVERHGGSFWLRISGEE